MAACLASAFNQMEVGLTRRPDGNLVEMLEPARR